MAATAGPDNENQMTRTNIMPALLALLILLWCLPVQQASCARSGQAKVFVVHGDSRIAEDFAHRLRERLAETLEGTGIELLEHLPPATEAERHGRFLVLVGGRTLQAYRSEPEAWRLPALVLLVTRQRFEQTWHQLPEGPRSRLSAVYLDQPPSRQFLLAIHAFPQRKRIGVLLSRTTLPVLPLLKKLSQGTGRRLVTQRLASEGRLFPVMERLFERSDVFLALPDPEVVNRTTLQPLLLTSYRYRIPVVAFSRAYVKAGATAAVYTPPEGLIEEAAEIVNRQLSDGPAPLPPPHYSSRFRVHFNRRVARSLGIALPSEHQVEQAIRAWEANNR